MTIDAFNGFYRGKTVLVTGHTGFKGTWLAIWLEQLGARVVGYALAPPSEPSHFTVSRLGDRIVDVRADVRDVAALQRTFEVHQPDVVFHLAAQSLVRLSYSEPRQTFDVNLNGTVNVLDTALRCSSVAAAISITSDKCYKNVGQAHGYAEDDTLGGHDPYSASKACAELAIAVYQDPRFQTASARRDLPIASARAGNVIGGGDWAKDRIVPDVVRAIEARRDLVIRSPHATRPWQHVLEPLSGYLWLGARVGADPSLRSGWNFGPEEGRAVTVAEVVQGLLDRFRPPATRLVIEPDTSGTEAMLLQLDCTKARERLAWRPTFDLDETLDAIVEWYAAAARGDADMYAITAEQLGRYTRRARAEGIRWACQGTP